MKTRRASIIWQTYPHWDWLHNHRTLFVAYVGQTEIARIEIKGKPRSGEYGLAYLTSHLAPKRPYPPRLGDEWIRTQVLSGHTSIRKAKSLVAKHYRAFMEGAA